MTVLSRYSWEPYRTRAYSDDIRWKIVWLRSAKQYSCRKIASQFCVGFGTVLRTLQMFKANGEVSTNPRSSRPHIRTLDDYQEYFIKGLVLVNPSIHLDE